MSLLASEMDKENITVDELATEQGKLAVSPLKTPEEAVETFKGGMETETTKEEPEEEKETTNQEEDKEQNKKKAPEPVEKNKKSQKWRYLEEGEELVGALEMSPMIDGKRRRSTVNRLVPSAPVIKEAYTGGLGAPLSEEPHFMTLVAKLSSEELKPIHRVLYGNPGKKSSIKKELRKFNGFPFKENSTEYEKRRRIITSLKSKEFALLQSIFKKYYWPKEDRKNKENYAKELLKILLEPPTMEKKAGKKRPTTAEKPKAKRGKPAKKTVESDDEEEEEVEDPVVEKEKQEKSERKQRSGRMKAKYAEEENDEEDDEEEEEEVKKPKAKKRQYKQLTESEDSDESDDEKDEKDEETGEKDEENEENNEKESKDQDSKKSDPSEEDLARVCTEILKNVDFNMVTKAQIYEMICKKFPKMNAEKRKHEIKAVVVDTVKKLYVDD